MIVVLLALLALIGECLPYAICRVRCDLLALCGSLRRAEKNARKKKKIDFFSLFFGFRSSIGPFIASSRIFRFNIDVEHYNIRNGIVALPPFRIDGSFFLRTIARSRKNKKKKSLKFFFFFFFFSLSRC
jgi:hypothetical protein